MKTASVHRKITPNDEKANMGEASLSRIALKYRADAVLLEWMFSL
jgi:hypothetical protein